MVSALNVFVDSNSNNQLIEKWAKSNKYFLFTVSSFGDFKEIKKNNISYPFLFINYPVDDKEDLQTIQKFIEESSSKNAYSFYSPRPNAYVHPSSRMLVFSPSTKEIIENFHHIKNKCEDVLKKFSNFMPNFLKKPLKKFYQYFLENSVSPKALNQSTSSQNNISSDNSNLLEIIIPNDLKRLNNNWLSWTPPSHIIKRDLIDRIQYFYPYPQGIHVILANKCNLSCVMCPYHSPKYQNHHTSGYFDEKRSMNFEMFKKIADYAGKNKISLQFGQIEEPLLHKEAIDFYFYAKQQGVPHIHMTTNGTLLTQEKADKLIRSGIDSVMFSLDAQDPETYKNIRGFHLGKTEKNIEYFLKASRGKNIKTWVSFILQDQSEDEKKRFLEKWKNMGIDHVTFYVLTDHDPKTGKPIRTEEFYEKGERYPCASPWVQSVVYPDGEISLCCKTMIEVGWNGIVSVGSLKDSSFDDIWRSEHYSKVRYELLMNTFEEYTVCSDCPIWSASTQNIEKTSEYTLSYNETMKTYQFHQ